MSAYGEDVVLAPDVRGEGIGRLLVNRLLELVPPTAVTSLFCSPALTGFYAETSFRTTSQSSWTTNHGSPASSRTRRSSTRPCAGVVPPLGKGEGVLLIEDDGRYRVESLD